MASLLAREARADRRLFRYRHGAPYPQFRYLIESARGDGWALEWVGELPEAFRRHSERLRRQKQTGRKFGYTTTKALRGRVVLIDRFGQELRGRTVWEDR